MHSSFRHPGPVHGIGTPFGVSGVSPGRLGRLGRPGRLGRAGGTA